MRLRRWKTVARRRVVFMLAACFCGTTCVPGVVSAAGYMDASALGKRLRQIARSHQKLVRLNSVARSLDNRDVWLVELGRGNADERRTRPAMLVVAGIEGNDLAGCAAAVTWVERLAGQHEKKEEVRRLLDTTTIYVFPRLNPDAAENFFARRVFESSVSTTPVDDDHDGITDEDGPEDVNGDGRITWMRVEDPEGEYILDPIEPRLLVKADETKGEAAEWRFLTEGLDNDGDEKWNEDGPGGVNFNRNFPHEYKWFAPWSGLHQVSEIETRALAGYVWSPSSVNGNLRQTEGSKTSCRDKRDSQNPVYPVIPSKKYVRELMNRSTKFTHKEGFWNEQSFQTRVSKILSKCGRCYRLGRRSRRTSARKNQHAFRQT